MHDSQEAVTFVAFHTSMSVWHPHIRDIIATGWLLPSFCHRLMSQLKRDADFLRSIGVMDYSLLLGIHFTSSRQVLYQGEGMGSLCRKLSYKCVEILSEVPMGCGIFLRQLFVPAPLARGACGYFSGN